MCGRYTLRSSPKAIAEAFGLADLPDVRPRFNIAPTQQVLAIRQQAGQRQASLLHWGLIPSWANDPAIGNRMINARSESVAEKPSFRSAFKKGRCLVVADGFYEWKKDGQGEAAVLHTAQAGSAVCLCRLAEHWHRGDHDDRLLLDHHHGGQRIDG